MKILAISLNAIAPLFLLMILGNIIIKCKLISSNTTSELNRITFLIFIPVLLFNNIYQTNIKDVIQPKLIAYSVLALLTLWGISFVVTILIEKEPSTRGAMIQGMYRSNFTLYGLPVVVFLYGESNVGVTSFMIAIVVPMANILAVVTFEIFKKGKPNLKKFFYEMVRNPIMIGSVCGIVALLLNIDFPGFLEKGLNTVGSLAVPMSLIIIGATFSVSATRFKLGKLAITVAMRLVILPLIFISIGVVLGFRDIELATLMALFATPTAIVSYPMAVQMGSDEEFARNTVIFSTLFSGVTMFLCVCILQKLSLICII